MPDNHSGEWVIFLGKFWRNVRTGQILPIIQGGALPATDAFTGTDWTYLTDHSASWSNVLGSFQLYSNALYVVGESIARWNADTPNNDQYAQGKHVALAADKYMGVAVRCSTTQVTAYCLVVNNGYQELYKYVNNSYGALGTGSVAWAANDVSRIEAEGTTIRSKKNGSTTGMPSATNSDISSGQLGVCGSGSSTSSLLDDWEGGNIGEAPVIKSLTDTGAGSDNKPIISASLSRTDIGAGTDVKPTLAASLSRSDIGTGTDSRTLSASLSRSDASQGSDRISPPSASLSLPERGVANEQSVLSASVSKSDVGAGIDNPASLSSLGLSDGALGGDFLDLSALDIINEIGSGSDTLSGLLASLGMTENISGSDLLQLLASLSLSDVGSGSDAINILTALIVAIQDTASGVDGLSISVSLSLVDIGNGLDGLSIQVSLSVSDTATGTDLETVIKALITAISVADTALGSDSGLTISASLNIPEPGYGLDTPTIAALITGYDISITSDSPQIQASLTLTDTSSASDGLSILQTLLKIVQDLASGTDFVGNISASIPVSELGLGVDQIGQLLASLLVTDFGTGVEVITTINITTQIIKISFIIKKSAITFAFACPRIEFGLSKRQVEFSFLDGG